MISNAQPNYVNENNTQHLIISCHQYLVKKNQIITVDAKGREPEVTVIILYISKIVDNARESPIKKTPN